MIYHVTIGETTRVVELGPDGVTVDGIPVDFSETFTYKGMCYSDVPNLASSFGYINASWTLRADLTCQYVCRLLNHMRDTGTDVITPRLRPSDRDMQRKPFIADFSSGRIGTRFEIRRRTFARAISS